MVDQQGLAYLRVFMEKIIQMVDSFKFKKLKNKMFKKPEGWKHKQRPTKAKINWKTIYVSWVISKFCALKSIGFSNLAWSKTS